MTVVEFGLNVALFQDKHQLQMEPLIPLSNSHSCPKQSSVENSYQGLMANFTVKQKIQILILGQTKSLIIVKFQFVASIEPSPSSGKEELSLPRTEW